MSQMYCPILFPDAVFLCPHRSLPAPVSPFCTPRSVGLFSVGGGCRWTKNHVRRTVFAVRSRDCHRGENTLSPRRETIVTAEKIYCHRGGSERCGLCFREKVRLLQSPSERDFCTWQGTKFAARKSVSHCTD